MALTVRELLESISGYDPDMEVQVRIACSTDDATDELLAEWFGEYCEVTDERSVLVEYGKLTIIGDWEAE
jgi:hypothetical protein